MTVVDDLDIWAEVGHDRLLRKVVECESSDGLIIVDFLEVKAGQALVSAIAVSTKDQIPHTEYSAPFSDWSWEAADKVVEEKLSVESLQEENSRPVKTYKAVDARCSGSFTVQDVKNRKVVRFNESGKIEWDINAGLSQIYSFRFKYMNTSGKPVGSRLELKDKAGDVVKRMDIIVGSTVISVN